MAKRPDDDLFAGSTMSFGEHLEELRKALIKAIYGLLVGMILGLYFANSVVEMIQQPLTAGLEAYHTEKAEQDLRDRGENVTPELLATIEKFQRTPTRQYVDPGELLGQLSIEQSAESEPTEYNPYRFRPEDLIDEDLPEFCKKLEGQGREKKDPPHVGQLIWPLLSQDERELISRLAEASEVSRTDQRALAELLNDLAGNRRFAGQLYDAEKEILAVVLPESAYRDSLEELARQMAAGEEAATAEEARRLVRLLMPAAYPDAIEPYVLPMVPLTVWEPMDVTVKSFGASEAFMIWLKAGVVTGFIVASPWIFWQMWSFVAAGLYPHERRYVWIYLPFSLALFVAGVLLAYFFVFSHVLGFLFGFNLMTNIPIDPRISEWIGFVLILPLGFGLSFQLPLVMLFMERIGLFEVKHYLAKWRIAVVVIFVISMLLTPADPISMLLMATPLTGLYFLGVALCKWMPRRRNPYEDLSEA